MLYRLQVVVMSKKKAQSGYSVMWISFLSRV